MQWTYNTPWDTANSWLGALATDDAGNSYVTSGSSAAIQRVSTAGGMVWSATGGFLDEYWTIEFNYDQTILVIGGTRLGAFPPTGSNGMIFDINTANGNVNAFTKVTGLRPYTLIFPAISVTDINEVRSIAASPNGKYYYLTLDTIGAHSQNISFVRYHGQRYFQLRFCL